MTLPPSPEPERIELVRVALPLVRPHRTVYGVEELRRSTLVRVVLADNTEGWGECAALGSEGYASETEDTAFTHLRDVLVPGLLRGESLDTDDHPMAKSAVHGALVDAALRRDGQRLADVLGPGSDTVACCAVVSATSIDELLALVAVRVDEGYDAISVKIEPGWSLDPLRAVASAWPSVALSADANGSLEADSAELAGLDRLGLAYLEQPLRADDVAASARLSMKLETPIALDESVGSAADVERVAREGGSVIVNVKPARMGGLSETLRCLDAVGATGQRAFCGGMLETGVGRAHALAVAALDACDFPTHLGPSHNYFTSDLVAPFLLGPGATLAVPGGPGIGVTPDPGFLARVTVEAVEVEA